MPGGGKGGGAVLLAEYKGQKFKYNDLVDVIVGTGVGVPGKKTEPIKARFKAAVCTGLCVQSDCFWSLCSRDKEDTLLFRPEAAPKRKVIYFSTVSEFSAFSPCLIVPCIGRIMAVAQEELHQSLKRVRGECTRVKRKLEESLDKGERNKVKAVARAKVRIFCTLARAALAFFCVALVLHLHLVHVNAYRPEVRGNRKAYCTLTRLIARSH
jgi:hypothetical protein